MFAGNYEKSRMTWNIPGIPSFASIVPEQTVYRQKTVNKFIRETT
jgi:hypothetical protein